MIKKCYKIMSLAAWKISLQYERLIDAFLMRSMYFSNFGEIWVSLPIWKVSFRRHMRKVGIWKEVLFLFLVSHLYHFRVIFYQIVMIYLKLRHRMAVQGMWPCVQPLLRDKAQGLRTLFPGAQGRWAVFWSLDIKLGSLKVCSRSNLHRCQ